MACDRYYLDNVKEWFQEDVDVSDVEMVIAVPKGSTTVSVLADLVKPGVRVAIGQPDQCTIGALSRRMLESEDLYEKLKEKQKADGEIVVEKMSSALLVPDVIAGHVDAALVYISDVLPNIDDVDIVRITTTSNLAVQPFSIARTSDHKYLARRLFRRIAASSEAFESAGFNFRLDTPGRLLRKAVRYDEYGDAARTFRRPQEFDDAGSERRANCAVESNFFGLHAHHRRDLCPADRVDAAG
jgi:hypothetical protein